MSNQFSVDSNQFAERNLKTSRHAMFSAVCPVRQVRLVRISPREVHHE